MTIIAPGINKKLKVDLHDPKSIDAIKDVINSDQKDRDARVIKAWDRRFDIL